VAVERLQQAVKTLCSARLLLLLEVEVVLMLLVQTLLVLLVVQVVVVQQTVLLEVTVTLQALAHHKEIEVEVVARNQRVVVVAQEQMVQKHLEQLEAMVVVVLLRR
jgi:hypothetical protein